MPGKKKYPCLECKKNVDEGQPSVQCTICNRWIHKDCGLGDKLYNLILEVKESMGSHCWSCEGCSIGIAKMNKMVQNHDREIRELRKDVDDLKTQQSATKDLDERVTTLSSDLESLKTQPKSDNDAVFEEMRLRESKKLNVMIFGIDEPNPRLNDKAKKKVDEDVMLELFEELGSKLQMKDDIKFVARVGKAATTRPVVVGFRSQEARDKIMNSGWKLSKSTVFKNVSISPDLTARQVEEEKKLKKEAEARNEALIENDPDEAKNYTWKLVGVRGQRYIKKVENAVNSQQQGKDRAPIRGRIPSHRRTRAEMEDEDNMEEEEEGLLSQQRRKTYRQF